MTDAEAFFLIHGGSGKKSKDGQHVVGWRPPGGKFKRIDPITDPRCAQAKAAKPALEAAIAKADAKGKLKSKLMEQVALEKKPVIFASELAANKIDVARLEKDAGL